MNPLIQEHVWLFLQGLGFGDSALRSLQQQNEVQLDLGSSGQLYMEESGDRLLVALSKKLADHEVEDKLLSLLERLHHTQHSLFDLQIGLVGQNKPVVAIQLPFDVVTNAVIGEAVNLAVDFFSDSKPEEAF